MEGKDDWAAWCTAESFRTDCLAVATEVVLHPDARVLHLATASAVCNFGKQHAVEKRMPMSNYELDWPSVAKDYQGIIIAPYQWSIRLDRAVFWYYGWDCASGCIWDASAVESLVTRELQTGDATHG